MPCSKLNYFAIFVTLSNPKQTYKYMKNRYIVIMAGGIGTRFWPLSRDERPKQFLDILNKGETLLQESYKRFKGLCPKKNIFIVTSNTHRDLVIDQLGVDPANVLAEPERRNTAPCIAYAAYRIRSMNPDAVMVVSPSDHNIKNTDVFRKVINESFRFAEANKALLTLGMKPDRPETGYGYIQANMKKRAEGYESLMKVKTFTEKPDLKLARKFLESGDFYWNSGIFIWSVEQIINAFEKYLPDIYSTFDEFGDKFGTDKEDKIIGRVYSECSSISIDYGIMEKADNVYVRCADFGWSDLGTWGSISQHFRSDRQGNSGDIDSLFQYDLKKSIVKLPKDKIAVIQGLEDYIIVDSDDVLLIVHRDEEQNIRKFMMDIKKKKKDRYL